MAQVRTARNDWLISIADWCAVTSFLETDPYLARIVRAAYQKIPAYFSRPRVTVAVLDTPPVHDDPCLALVIASPGDEAEVMRSLELFEREWLHDALAHTRRKLCVLVMPGAAALPALDDGTIAAVLQARGTGYALSALPA
jgi:hypothetical protein